MSPNVEAFILGHNTFTIGDLLRLAQEDRDSTYSIRQQLESYGLTQTAPTQGSWATQ